MELSALAGNAHVKAVLSQQEGGRGLSHAYILSGPAGSGRHTLARLLCGAMLCADSGGERPCGHCAPCRKVSSGVHPDVTVISGPGEGKPITVDQVRALRSDAYIRPNEGERKIYLLEQADRMNQSAQNAMLKLLEEGRLPAGINHLRVGEGLLYGEDTTGMRFLEGYHTDAFHFKAQVVELRRKPSVPIGEHGRDGKGELPEYPDRGVHLRAICAAGKQDVAWAALTPTLPGAEMIGASSDHLIVDVEGCGGRVRVGDWLDFRCGYMAVLDATTSAYVDVREV